jgi:type II secretion system protein I
MTVTSVWRKRLVRNNRSGFTLLEVLVATAIMALALTSIFTISGRSIIDEDHAKQMNIVAMLARNKMIETELDIEGKTFDEYEKDKTAPFETPFEDYSWKRTVKEIKFPNLGGGGGGGGSSQNESEDQTSDMLSKLITNFLSKAIREVSVSIIWKRSGKDQSFTVTTYWVDLNHEFNLSE